MPTPVTPVTPVAPVVPAVELRHGLMIQRLGPGSPPVATPADASDLVGNAWSSGVDVVVAPVDRLDPAFFELRSGLAGEVVQKLTNYGLVLAVLGDVSALTSASSSLHALVQESNRGTHAWFVADEDELDAQLRSLAGLRGLR